MLRVYSKARKRVHNKLLHVKQDLVPDSAAQSRALTSQPASRTNRKPFKRSRMKLKQLRRIREIYLAKRTNSKSQQNQIPSREERPEASIKNPHLKMRCFYSEKDLMMNLKSLKVPIPNHKSHLIHFWHVIEKRPKPKLSTTKLMKICKISIKVLGQFMKKTLKRRMKMIRCSRKSMKKIIWSN